MGAIVRAFDVRSTVKEQIVSAGVVSDEGDLRPEV